MASVASPLHVAKPTIFYVAYLNLMRVSGVLGLASIMDGFKVWRGFLLQAITLYQEWIRLPIFNACMFLAGWLAGSAEVRHRPAHHLGRVFHCGELPRLLRRRTQYLRPYLRGKLTHARRVSARSCGPL